MFHCLIPIAAVTTASTTTNRNTWSFDMARELYRITMGGRGYFGVQRDAAASRSGASKPPFGWGESRSGLLMRGGFAKAFVSSTRSIRENEIAATLALHRNDKWKAK
jgi:hypothetical protein